MEEERVTDEVTQTLGRSVIDAIRLQELIQPLAWVDRRSSG